MNPSEEELFKLYGAEFLEAEADAMNSEQTHQAFATGVRTRLLRIAGFPSGTLETKKIAFNKRAKIESVDSETHFRITYDGKFPSWPLNFGMHEVSFEQDRTIITRRRFAISAMSGSAFRYIHRIRTMPNNAKDITSIRIDADLPAKTDGFLIPSFPAADIETLIPAYVRTHAMRVRLLKETSNDLLPILASLDPQQFTTVKFRSAEDGPLLS